MAADARFFDIFTEQIRTLEFNNKQKRAEILKNFEGLCNGTFPTIEETGIKLELNEFMNLIISSKKVREFVYKRSPVISSFVGEEYIPYVYDEVKNEVLSEFDKVRNGHIGYRATLLCKQMELTDRAKTAYNTFLENFLYVLFVEWGAILEVWKRIDNEEGGDHDEISFLLKDIRKIRFELSAQIELLIYKPNIAISEATR